jgi:hypothetical protein
VRQVKKFGGLGDDDCCPFDPCRLVRQVKKFEGEWTMIAIREMALLNGF